MGGRSFLVFFCLLFSLFTQVSAAQQSATGSIAITTDLVPAGDGMSATARCGVSGNDNGSNTYKQYWEFSTVCTVSSSDGAVVSTSSERSECNPVGIIAIFPEIGLGDSNNPSGGCSRSFAIVPGTTYTLTVSSYLYLWSGQDANAPPGAAACPSGTFWDPENWWTPSYQDTKDISNSGSGVKQILVSGPLSLSSSGVPNCIAYQDTIRKSEGYSGVIRLATTHAHLATIAITPDVGDYFQSQSSDYNSNIGSLRDVLGQDDSVAWCLLEATGRCDTNPASPSTENFLSVSGNSATFSTPNEALGRVSLPMGFTLYEPVEKFLCVQETLDLNNYACAHIRVFPLVIKFLRGNNVMLRLGQTARMVAVVDVSPGLTSSPEELPARDLVDHLGDYIHWMDWTISGTGSISQAEDSPYFENHKAYSIWNYMSANDGSAILSTGATIIIPYKPIITLPTTSMTVTADAALINQSISFDPIAPQSPGASVTLFASATSGLPSDFWSATPDVCAVSGNVAQMLSVGVCTLYAEQSGNSTYAAATVSQSFNAVGPYQGAVSGGLLIASTPEDVTPYTYQYDEGDVAVTVNGKEKIVHYSQLSTPAAIAANLAAYFSKDISSPVVAKAVGALVKFYPRSAATGQIAIRTSVVPSPQHFPHAAFTAQTQ